MKKLKKVIGLLCALTCAVTCTGALSACGDEDPGPSGPQGPTTGGASQELEIFATKAGYGIAFITEAVNQFKQEQWVKDKYPNLVVKWDENNAAYYSASSSNAVDKATAIGANKSDLIFTTQDVADKFAVLNGTGYYVEDLTDVYFGAIPGDSYYNGSGEGRYLKDKMYSDIWNELDVENVNGNKEGEISYYTMPAVNGWMGFVVNRDYIEQYAGAEAANNLPKTTDELVALCDAIIDPNVAGGKGVAIVCNGEGYESSQMRVWWTQYEGMTGYDNYFNFKVGNRTGADNWYQQGRLESLRVFEALFGGTNVNPPKYYDDKGTSGEYIEQQKTFLGGLGAMMYNGDWIENETRQAFVTIKNRVVYLKSPVVSAVVDKFPGAFTVRYDDATVLAKLGKKAQVNEDVDYGSQINKTLAAQADAQLSYLIGLIDEGKDYAAAKTAYDAQFSAAGVALTQEAYNHIAAARIMEHRVDGQEWYIPSYADGKEVAKDFLRFMASDKGTKILMEVSSTMSAFKVDDAILDYIAYSTTLQSRVERRNNVTALPTLAAYQSYRLAHLRHLITNSAVDSVFSNTGKSAWQVFKEEIDYGETKFTELYSKAFPN